MDESHFRTLFEATRGPLLAYLRQAAGEGTAEDLLQEAYIRFLHHPPRESDPVAQRCWLFTTATRLLRDHWRKDRRLTWLPWGSDDGDEDAPELPCDQPLPDRQAWTRQAVELGFRDLTPRQRTLLWLAHVEGFDQRELAHALGLTTGSARVLLHRARQRMGATLERHGFSGGMP